MGVQVGSEYARKDQIIYYFIISMCCLYLPLRRLIIEKLPVDETPRSREEPKYLNFSTDFLQN